jgi:hypothetical protein
MKGKKLFNSIEDINMKTMLYPSHICKYFIWLMPNIYLAYEKKMLSVPFLSNRKTLGF